MPAEFPQDDVALTINRCVEALSDLGVLRAELTVLRLIPEPRARFATALFDMERARQGDPEAQEQLARITQSLIEHQQRGTAAALARAHPALSQLWVTAQANLKSFGSSRLASLLATCYAQRHTAVELSRAVAALEPDDDRRVEFARCLYHLQLARLGVDSSRAEFARRVELVTEAFKSTDVAHELIGLDEGLRHLWNDLKPYLSEFFEVQEEVQRKLKRGDITTDPASQSVAPVSAMAPPEEVPAFTSSPTEPGRLKTDLEAEAATITARVHTPHGSPAHTTPEVTALNRDPQAVGEEPLENSARTVRVPMPVAPTPSVPSAPAASWSSTTPAVPAAASPPQPPRKVPGFNTLMGGRSQLEQPRAPMEVSASAHPKVQLQKAHEPSVVVDGLPHISVETAMAPSDSSRTAEVPFHPAMAERLDAAARDADAEAPIDEFTDSVIDAAEVVEASLDVQPPEDLSSVDVADMGEPADLVEVTDAPPPAPVPTAPHGIPALDVDIDEPPPDEATVAFWSESIRALQLLPNPEEVRVAGRVLSVDTKEDRRRIQEYLDSLEPWFIVPDAVAFGCLLRLALAGQLKEKSLFGQVNPRRTEAFVSAFKLLTPDPRAAAHGASWFQFDGAESEDTLFKGLEVLADFLGYCSRKGKDPLDQKAQTAFLNGGK